MKSEEMHTGHAKRAVSTPMLAVLIVILVAVSISGTLVFAVPSKSATTLTNTVTQTVTQNQTSTVQGAASVVNLVVIPDYGGAGYDAFVVAGGINGTTF